MDEHANAQRRPAGTEDQRDPVEALVDEFFARRRAGEAIAARDVVHRAPGREAEFLELVESLSVLESAGDGLVSNSRRRPAAAAEPPRRLGGYRLLQVVGRGGMGVVYEAVDDETQQSVALKVLSGGASLDERELSRFRREAQAAARLDHPHIVPVHGAGETEGTHWLAMRFIAGESLEHRLRRDREAGAPRMAPVEVARHGAAIADALAYAHGEGVLHRDVKPSNLLLDAGGAIWITDFGLAKSEGSATLTRTGETIGTPRYMAPEAFEGFADQRTDVWGLGATLYEMLAHRPAFDGTDRARLLRQIQGVEPAALLRVDPTLPRDLATIVHKCLQKEPAARYASARELADDLLRFCAGEPIRARSPSLAWRASLVARRHPTATTLLVLALAGGLTATTIAAARARDAGARAQRRFDDLRKLAGAFLFECQDAIRNLPGATPARALIAKRALAYLDALAKESGDDHGLRRELSAAYQRVGDVLGNPYQPNVGDIAGARASYRHAIELLEPVVRSGAASDEDRAVLASGYLVGGGIELVAGATDAAIEMSSRGLVLRRELAAAQPTPARRQEFATACQFHAWNLAAANRNDEALAALEEQAELLRVLRAAAPDDPALERSEGQNRYLIARQIELRGDRPGARAAYLAAIELQRRLIAREPANTTYRRDLGWPLADYAILERADGDLPAAVAAFREALALARSLAADDPESVEARLSEARALNNLGSVLVDAGTVQECIQNFDETIAKCEAIVATDPENAYAERLLGKACVNAALSRIRGEIDFAQAREQVRRGLAILDRHAQAGILPSVDEELRTDGREGLALCDARLGVSR